MRKISFMSMSLALVLAMTLMINSVVAAATSNAEYFSHSGNIYIQGTSTLGTATTIGEQVAFPDDGKFVQLGPDSLVILKFPGNTAAKPDGTIAADLRIDIYDAAYEAKATIYGSLNGTTWIDLGTYADTANINLDLIGPLKYIKVDQRGNYIDPAYPLLGFDLDAVVALNSGVLPYGEITKPEPEVTVSGNVIFEALYWDDDPGIVLWAVRKGTCAAATNTVFGNVDGFNSSYSWDGHLFQATADTTSWVPGEYCFVFNPGEESGEQDIRLTQFNVVSNNQPPTVDAGGPYLGAVNTAILFDGSGSTDPDGDDLTYAWNFGDGSMGEGMTPTHSYTVAGIHNVCLTVNDGFVISPEVCTIAVVYDPSSGFVTGGGWIDSPVNEAYPYMQVGGKATFGFVAKYKKGANVPDGNTEFQFKAGNLNFHSTSYDWLVVAGNQAIFKGLGTINGEGSYKFMITSDDDSPDTFRIKIWSEVDEIDVVAYDNGSQQALGGGSIVIHK